MLAANYHVKNLDDMIPTHLNWAQRQALWHILKKHLKITLQTSSSLTYRYQCKTISWQAISSPTFAPSTIKERSWKTMWDWSSSQNKQLQMGCTSLCHT
jgi:hypothetical protein